jgi:flagellar hook-associated protein 3 FlgL
MRVTESIKFANVTSQLGQLRERYANAVQQSSGGKRVNAPSDDPIAAAEDARVQASLSQTKGFRETISTVQGDLELAESSLDSAGQVLQRALEIAMSGSNGSNTDSQYEAFATEASQLIDTMIAIGNTKGSQGYLFAGTKSEEAPFDSTGAYVGNENVRQVSIDGGTPTTVMVSGANAFANATGRNVIQDLKDLTAALTSGDRAAVSSLLTVLQDSHSQIVQERANAGLMLDRLSMTDSFLSQTSIDLTDKSSTLTDADAVETLSTLSQLQTTIQQTLAVDQKLLQTTAMTLNM